MKDSNKGNAELGGTGEEAVHIGLEILDPIPDLLANDLVKEIQAPGLLIKVNRYEPRIYASLDWLMPTAIAAYILKPYFEGFFSQAGEDHYFKLKNWLKNLSNNGRKIKIVTLNDVQSTEKVSNSGNQSKSVSIIFENKNGRSIKLLFDNNLTQDDWDNAIEQMVDLLVNHYKEFPHDRLSMVTEGLEQDVRFELYVIIDSKSKSLLFYDHMGIYKLQRDKHLGGL